MTEQPTLFDPPDDRDPDRQPTGLELLDPQPRASASLEPTEPPTTDTGRDPDHAHDLKFDTDLPLPKFGKGGNHVGSARQALAALQAAGIGLDEVLDLVTNTVPGPPLNTIDAEAIKDWIDEASRRIVDYQRSWRLRRAVLDLLDAQFRLDYNASEHARLVRQQAEDHAAKVAGTYWSTRDGRRTSTRPIHVDVAPEAWEGLKLDATRRGTTLGEVVGDLVRAEAEADGQVLGQVCGEVSDPWSGFRGEPGEGRRAKVFARIAVEDRHWYALKAIALASRITIARAVGLLVEVDREKDG